MRVRIDQSRQDVLAFEIERLHAGGCGRGSDRRDPSRSQHDRRVRRDVSVANVHDVPVDQRKRISDWLRRLRSCQRNGERERKSEATHHILLG